MDSILITKKLEQFKEYFSKIKHYISDDTETILKDELKYFTLERLFQLLVDTCVDINIYLIREGMNKIPDDLRSTFLELGKGGILSQDLAEKMAPVVGLRNRIVHRYDTVNQKKFIELLKSNTKDFELYFETIRKKIKQ